MARMALLFAVWLVANEARAGGAGPGLELQVWGADAAQLSVTLRNQGDTPIKIVARADAFSMLGGPVLRERKLENDEVVPPVVELEAGESQQIHFVVVQRPLADGTLVYRAVARDCGDCWHGELRAEVAIEPHSMALSLRAPRHATVGAPVIVKLALASLANRPRNIGLGAPCRDVVLTVDAAKPRPITSYPCSDRPVYIFHGAPLTRTTTLTFDTTGEHVLRAFYDGLSYEIASPTVIVDVKPRADR